VHSRRERDLRLTQRQNSAPLTAFSLRVMINLSWLTVTRGGGILARSSIALTNSQLRIQEEEAMRRELSGAGLFLFLTCSAAAGAQEASYFGGFPAVRFEQSPGVFHVMYACQPPLEMARLAQAAAKPAGIAEPALCWLVSALRMSRNGATYNASPVVDAHIMITAHSFRLIPVDTKDADLYAEFRSDEINVQHKSAEAFAFFGSKDVFYKFGFKNMCTKCESGTPAPPATNTAELDAEFETFRDSIRHFETAQQRITDMGSKIRVEIRPNNQPGMTDTSETLKLYADLNERFAELCAEPAKSCVRSFAAFQKCKSGSGSADCNARPACSEACVISMNDLRKLKADACVQWDQSGASLSPDWTEAVQAQNKNKVPRPTFTPGIVELQAPPGAPNAPTSAGCSVSKLYERASTALPGVAGMAALGGLFGLGGSAPPRNEVGSPYGPRIDLPLAPQTVNIAAGVAVGMITKKVAPEYPAVAKAARVQGTIVLQATISKTGTIQNLRVISGPPLLQQAALDAVQQWQYRPYLLMGQPVEVETTVNVIFTLGDSSVAAPPAAPAQTRQ
jgi:TonB family protein